MPNQTERVYFADKNEVREIEVAGITPAIGRGPLADELLRGVPNGRVDFVDVPGYRIEQVVGQINGCQFVAIRDNSRAVKDVKSIPATDPSKFRRFYDNQ